MNADSARDWVMQRLDLRPTPVRAGQYVHVSQRAMHDPSVVGHRREGEGEPFTGWEIVSTREAPGSASFGYYTVEELAAQHPEWMAALHLPPGWSFRFAGHTLVDAVSPQGTTHTLKLAVDLP